MKHHWKCWLAVSIWMIGLLVLGLGGGVEAQVTFTDVAGTAGVADTSNTNGIAWGDYDGDGYLDLYLANSESSDRLYLNNGDGSFTDVAVTAGVDDGSQGPVAAWGDYDGDGLLDLYLCTNTANRLYHNSGDGTFEDRATSAGVNNSDRGTGEGSNLYS